MTNRNSVGADKRVPIAVVLMAFVLTLLGSQLLLGDQSGPEAGRPGRLALAAAPSIGR